MRENAVERGSSALCSQVPDRLRKPAALASGSANCYGLGMLSRRIPRTSALLAALVLAVGLVTHGFAGPDMVVKPAGAMPMSSDMPMTGKCYGCAGDEKGMAPAACSAFCSAVIAAPSVAAVFDAVPIDILGPSAGRIVTGHADPPDPHPPRPTIVS